MSRAPWWTLTWPGLPALWRQGSWQGLIQAIAFALLLNTLILCTYGWSEISWVGFRVVGWLLVGGWWGWAAWRTGQTWHELAAAGESADVFPNAQREYLKGNWFQAEQLLMRLLQRNNSDVDARLLLVTLLRHTKRRAAAAEQLRRLEKTDGAEKWRLEIHREWTRLTAPEESEQLQSEEAAQAKAEQQVIAGRVGEAA